MDKIKSKVDAFMRKYGMHYEDIDMNNHCKTFLHEIEQGLNGTGSTLKMLCTYLSPKENIPVDEPVIVIDAGGTNFRVAVVTFDIKKRPIIEDFKCYSMPGTHGEISKDEFFATIVKYLEPVIGKSDKIGFCFSYPTQILPNKDGKLIRFNKEVQVREVNDEKIGENLLIALKNMGYDANKKIILLNDTVATLLGGKAAYPDRKFDSFIGFILGTGTNSCYIEKNYNIKKERILCKEDGSTIINIESGGYGKAQGGRLDKIFDNSTVDPRTQQFEKMISGAYQGRLIFETIKKARSEALFSKKFSDNINSIDTLLTTDINDFCLHPYSIENVLGKCISIDELDAEKNRTVLFHIIDIIIERAAKLVAINIASVILKTGLGKNPYLPVCIAAEGTTFYKSMMFKSKLDYYVRTYLNDQLGIYCEFVKVENATLIGTAIAGLSN